MATIKTQLEASGVSKFQQQMRQASGAVKAMGAELKVAEAAYQQTGDQATYLAEKSSILKQQLEEQKRAVSAAEQALEQVKKQYGENSSQANAWRTKLAQARATLIQTETAIKNTDAAMDALGKDDVSGVADGLEDVDKKAQGAKKSADDLGESVGNIDQKLDVQAITGAIDKITGGFDRVIQKAAQMGKAIWEASMDAANWADATRDAADQAHMTTTEYQQLGYAAQFFGTSVEGLTKSQGRLSKAMASADEEVIQVGESLVNTMAWVEDGTGGYIRKKRSWSDVLLDTLDALGEIEDYSERDAAAMDIFGKSYGELSAIMEQGTGAFRQRMNEAPVVSETTVNSLADTADHVKDTNSQLEVLKLELLNALSPSIQTIADAVGSLAKQLTAFVQSEKGQRLLAQLGESIATIITNLTEHDFDTVVQTAADVLSDLNDAFEWISQNYVGVAIAIGTITAAVGALKIASAGLTLATGLNSLQQLLGKGGTGTGTGTGTGAPTTAPTVAGGGSLLGPGLALIGATKVFLDGSVAQWNENQRTAENVDRVLEGTRQAAEETAQLMKETEKEYDPVSAGARQSLLSKGMSALHYVQDPNAQAAPGVGMYVAPTVINERGLLDVLRDYQGHSSFLQGMLSPETYNAMMSATTDGFMGIGNIGGQQAWDLVNTITGELAAAEPELKQAGEDTVTGYAEGMEASMSAVNDAANNMAGGPLNIIKQVLDMHSPSRVMEELGEMAGIGFANGLAGTAGAVAAAASALAAAATGTINGALSSIGGSVGGINSGGSFSAISNLYIGSYNQNGGGDVNALASAMAAAQTRLRQGFGARK